MSKPETIQKNSNRKATKRIEAEKVEVVGSEKEGYRLPKPKTSSGPVMKFIRKNWFTIFVILYFFMPIDFIPDFIPILGQVDDGGLILIEVARRLYEWRSKENETSRT